MENTPMLELIFIPCPAPGHIVSTVEFANRLLSHNPRFQATVILMNEPWNSSSAQKQEETAKTEDDPHSNRRLRYINLPEAEHLPPLELFKESPEVYFFEYIASHNPQVRDIVKNNPSRLAGIMVDMFCASMIDVANEFNIPSYLFFTSGAAFLGVFLDLPTLNLHLHLQSKKEDGQLVFTESNLQSHNLAISTFANPLPFRVLPALFVQKPDAHKVFSDQAKRFPETKGIIVNTFEELEPYAIKSLSTMTSNGHIPSVYTVGPVLNLQTQQPHGNLSDKQRQHIMRWLDAQPDASVIFLCFGTRGAFTDPQVKEIANGIQQSGLRFIWALRKPPPSTGDGLEQSQDYTETELNEFLPPNFLSLLEGDETRHGLICGWAPQMDILAHRAVGGFVSHCGWNSTLESLWFGKPIVTWPLYAEQHCNAFQLVKELGLGVELRIDYRRENGDMVTADEVERAVRCVMDMDNQIRKKVGDISKISKRTLMDGGSSFKAIDRLIRDMRINLGD